MRWRHSVLDEALGQLACRHYCDRLKTIAEGFWEALSAHDPDKILCYRKKNCPIPGRLASGSHEPAIVEIISFPRYLAENRVPRNHGQISEIARDCQKYLFLQSDI
jgi:hypothetical protein